MTGIIKSTRILMNECEAFLEDAEKVERGK